MSRITARGPVLSTGKAIVLIAVLLVAAVVVTSWRYDNALTKADAAQESTLEVYESQQATTAFWHEREAMNEYLLLRDAALIAEVDAQRDAFGRLQAALPPGDHQAAEARLVDEATAANDAFVARFKTLRARPDAALRELNALEEAVTAPIERLRGSSSARSTPPAAPRPPPSARR